jgi:hypothetical protein
VLLQENNLADIEKIKGSFIQLKLPFCFSATRFMVVVSFASLTIAFAVLL